MSDSNVNDNINNAINNKKKNSEKSNDESPNYGKFISRLCIYTIYILITFLLIGSIGLYICKVAQANVLPDNLNYLPFGDKVKEIPEIPINSNIIKVFGLMGFGRILGQKPIKEESTKIVFNSKEILKGYENGILGVINSLKSNPERASFFGLYISDLLSSIIATNNLIINYLFGIINKYCSETIILLFFPLLLLFLIIFMIISNIFFCFFYQIKNFSDFFMNKNVKNNTVTWTEPFTYLRPWRAFLLLLYCFFLFFPIIGFIPFFTTFYSIFSPLGLIANIYNTDKKISFGTFLKDVAIYKSQFFLILFTFGLLYQSSNYLGSDGFIGCLVGILIVNFVLHLYNPFSSNNDNQSITPGIVSSDQAKVKLNMKGGTKKK
jgi:hypothetical protein